MKAEKITKTYVDALPYTQGRPKLYFDTALKGFGVRVGQRSKTFFVQRDIRGRTQVKTIGRYGIWTVDQARRTAQEKLFLMSQGIDPDEEEHKKRRQRITLQELGDEFCQARKQLKERTKTEYQYYLKKYLPDWLEKPVTEITESMVLKRYFEIGENSGPTTANSVRRILRALINYGMAAHKLFDKNPVNIIAETKSAYPINRRRSYIKPSQLKTWYEAVNNLPNRTYRDYLLLVLFSGLRRNEAASLRFSDISFADKTMTILETKNNDPLTLPLSDFLEDLLRDRRMLVKESPYVFPGVGKTGHLMEPKKGVEMVRKWTGIDFTVHDLRRSFVTYAESLDISHYALKALLNHRNSDITGSYVIVDVERLRAPMQKITNFIKEKIHEPGGEGKANL